MSAVIAWMAAEAERPEKHFEGGVKGERDGAAGTGENSPFSPRRRDPFDFPSPGSGSPGACVGQSVAAELSERQSPRPVSAESAETRTGHPAEELPAHQFPTDSPAPEEAPAEDPEVEQERRIYRGRTIAMLRRYMQYAIETGRLPSLLGREFFRAKVTQYTVVTFEDRVIFVHDMERCLEQLDEFSRRVLARVVLQEYDHKGAARLLGCTRMTVHRRLLQALDQLSDVLLEVGLLEVLSSPSKKSCQEGESSDFFLSDCEQGK